MTKRKKYFGDGSVWTKVEDSASGEVLIENEDTGDTRHETTVDWDDENIYTSLTCPECGSDDTEERENLGKTHQHCNACSYGWSA